MAKLDYREAVAALEGAETVAICGHINPDGDCLGSALALTLALRSRGCQVTPLLPTRECPALYDFLEGYDTFVAACDYEGTPDVLIALDVPGLERMGDDASEVFRRSHRTIAIDHHQGMDRFADVNMSDPQAAAAGMLVWDFIEQLGIQRTPAIASCCYAAVVTDTGRFQFQNTDASALSAAASMTCAGAIPSEICRQIYQRRSIPALQLSSLVVQRMEFFCDGRAVVSWVTEKDFEELGASKDDGESLIDEIRQLDGVEVAVMLRAQGPSVRGSIRAKTDRDVASIARKMGGGGHVAAAGFTIVGDLFHAREVVIPLLRESFEKAPVSEESLAGEATRTSLFPRIDTGERR